MPLDLDKLENVSYRNNKILSVCPACFNEKGSRGLHLCIYENGNGPFGCAVDNTPEHRSLIYKLVGFADDKEFKPTPRVIIEKDEKFDPSIINALAPDHSYWIGRGIDEKIFDNFKAGICESGKMKGRHVTLIEDNNNIIGADGRDLYDWGDKKRPKYKKLGNKSQFIFPYNLPREHPIVLVESIGCIFSLLTVGINCLCLFGVNLSKKLLNHLISLNPNKIIIATNNENSGIGNSAAQSLKERLDNYFDNVIIKLPKNKDINEDLCKLGNGFVKNYYSFN